jgi:hypothetical protein
MNMENGNKAAQFDFWEYIIRLFFAVQIAPTWPVTMGYGKHYETIRSKFSPRRYSSIVYLSLLTTLQFPSPLSIP